MKKINGKATIEVYTDGKETKVFLEGPADLRDKCSRQIKTNGTSSCNETDKFDKWLGICIALGRALKVPEIRLEKLANALGEKKSLVGAVYKNLGIITRETTYQNGERIYQILRFSPMPGDISSTCKALDWTFRLKAREIQDEDITWRDYKVVEKKFGEPAFPLDREGSIVQLFGEPLAFITGYDARLCLYTVRLLKSGETVKIHKNYVKPVSISAYNKVISRWEK